MHGVISNRWLVSGGLCFAILCSLFIFPSPGVASPGVVASQAEVYDPPSPAASEPLSISGDFLPRGYIPFLVNCHNAPAGIYGYVTKAGIPASAVTVKLWLRNQTVDSEIATTVTNSCGYFSFINVPDVLVPEKGYFVRFRNTGIQGCLLQWDTRVLTPYTGNSAVNIENFDIGDVTLIEPTGNTSLPFPVTFRWTKRAQSPSDRYTLYITEYNPGEPNPYNQKYKSPLLDYVDNIQISRSDIKSDLVSDKLYYWYVDIRTADGAIGYVSHMNGVRFSIP